jgi:hypothetical protein
VIAFQVEIDGEQIVLAGVEDWSILALHMTGSRSKDTDQVENTLVDEVRFSVGGLSRPDTSSVRYHFRWKNKDLRVGSQVAVKVVETEHPDPPVKRYRSDKEIQENPFTDDEMRAMRRQDYEALKKEFEGNE